MELQTQHNQDLATTEQFQTVRFQGVQSLPTEFLNTLPEIVRAEITQSTLKQTSLDNPNEIEAFINEVFAKVNPTFTDGENGVKLAESEIRRYAKQSLITREEFFIARTLLSRDLLFDFDGNPLKPFKIIDFEFFNKVETAYINFRNHEKTREIGIAKLKAFLEPPKPEPTEEELKEQRLKFYSEEYKRLQRYGKVLGTTIFYDLIKKEGLETVKLKWLEVILDKFKPETVDKSLINEPQLVKLPKIKKHDAKTFFIDELVHAYFVNKKLKDLSEEDFINHWENIFS